MILNNLAVILAEKKLTATRVSKDTGISRSTLSALVNNTGEGIQLKTLDILCVYLGIEIQDFFELYPYTVETDVTMNNFDIKIEWADFNENHFEKVRVIDFSFDLLLTVQGKNNVVSRMDFVGKGSDDGKCSFDIFYEQDFNEWLSSFQINTFLDIASNDKINSFNSWWEKIPDIFQERIRDAIIKETKKAIDLEFIKKVGEKINYESVLLDMFAKTGSSLHIFSNFLDFPKKNDLDSLPF